MILRKLPAVSLELRRWLGNCCGICPPNNNFQKVYFMSWGLALFALNLENGLVKNIG